MKQHSLLDLKEKIISTLENFEKELPQIREIETQDKLQLLVEKVNHLHDVLDEVRQYFIEVRSKLSDVQGIPPAKELAQIVIGATTEALGAIRETLLHLEVIKGEIKSRGRRSKIQETLRYAESSAKEVVRGTQRIIKRIDEHAEEIVEGK
jgi:predicted RNA-binding protein with EMAP domain